MVTKEYDDNIGEIGLLRSSLRMSFLEAMAIKG